MVFPSPVGGVALPADFAPSILFAVLYGLLVPLVAFRIYDRRSRTTVLIGTIVFAIERIVIYSLRAIQAHNETRRVSKGLATYMQISFGLGFIGIANDLVNLLRCLLVNPTYGPERYPESATASTKGTLFPAPIQGEPDHPRQRFWARRFSDFTNLAFLAATVPGIIANSKYSKTFDDPVQSHKTYVFRYASSAVALFLMLIIVCAAAWSYVCQPRASKRGIAVISTLAYLTGMIAIYRLIVMHHTTTSLTSTAPGSQNVPGAKAGFYICHALPEWIAIAILLGVNVRKAFGTGLFGDWRYRDETPKEKVRREKWVAKHTEKKEKREGVVVVPVDTL